MVLAITDPIASNAKRFFLLFNETLVWVMFSSAEQMLNCLSIHSDNCVTERRFLLLLLVQARKLG